MGEQFIFAQNSHDFLNVKEKEELIGVLNDESMNCTNQQPPQRGDAVPDAVWGRSK